MVKDDDANSWLEPFPIDTPVERSNLDARRDQGLIPATNSPPLAPLVMSEAEEILWVFFYSKVTEEKTRGCVVVQRHADGNGGGTTATQSKLVRLF